MFTNTDWLWMTGIHMIIWTLLFRAGKGKVDIFNPFYIVTGIYALVFIYGPYVWMQRGQTSYQGVEVMEYMPTGMLVFNIGYFFYAVASYMQKAGKYRRKNEGAQGFAQFLEEPATKVYITRYAWCVFLVSMILSLVYYRLIGRSLWFMITLGQGAELNQIRAGYGIYFLMEFIRSAIPGCLLLIVFSKKLRPLIYLCTYILCAVCISTGSRNLAICVVLAIAVYHYMKNGKRPAFTTLAVAFLILYLFVGMMGIFRTTIKTGGQIDLSIVNSDTLFGAFMYNIEIFYPFFSLVGSIADGFVSYHYGLGFLNIVLQFIPRAIWASKPAMLGLTAFEAMYGSSMGGAAYPNIGEFYYEFGIVGVILFMVLTGVVLQRIFYYARYSTNKLTIVTYAIVFGYLLQYICRGHLASWAIDIVFMLGPLYYLKKKLIKMYHRQISASDDSETNQNLIVSGKKVR